MCRLRDWGTVFVAQHVKIGEIYDDTKVVRVDRGSGLLLEVPSIPESTPAFVSVCSVCTRFNDVYHFPCEIWMVYSITISIKPNPTREIWELLVFFGTSEDRIIMSLLLTDIWCCWSGDPKTWEKIQGRKSGSSSDSRIKAHGRPCYRSFEGCHCTCI